MFKGGQTVLFGSALSLEIQDGLDIVPVPWARALVVSLLGA